MSNNSSNTQTTLHSKLKETEAELLQEQQRISELVHLVSIHSNNNDNNSQTTTSSSQNVNETIQQLTKATHELSDQISRKKLELQSLYNNNNRNRSSASSSSSITNNDTNIDIEIDTLLNENLPQSLLQRHKQFCEQTIHIDYEHDLFQDLLLRQHLQPKIDELLSHINGHFQQRFETEIAQKEKEIRLKRIAPEEDEGRIALLQQWNTETKNLVDRIREQVSTLNLRGSELQHTLGTKREEYQQVMREYESVKNENIDVVPQSPKIKRSKEKADDDEEEEDDDDDQTAEILVKLQNQFAELHEELHLRPTHQETGLERLREQILTLSQELVDTRIALADAIAADEDEQQQQQQQQRNSPSSSSGVKIKNSLALKKEIFELKKLRKMKNELQNKIQDTRSKIEQDQKTISEELRIDARREEFEKKQRLLQEEINLLRDTLYDVEEEDE